MTRAKTEQEAARICLVERGHEPSDLPRLALPHADDSARNDDLLGRREERIEYAMEVGHVAARGPKGAIAHGFELCVALQRPVAELILAPEEGHPRPDASDLLGYVTPRRR